MIKVLGLKFNGYIQTKKIITCYLEQKNIIDRPIYHSIDTMWTQYYVSTILVGNLGCHMRISYPSWYTYPFLFSNENPDLGAT